MYLTDPHAPGAKMDDGKLRVGLMVAGFPRALAAVAAVATYGARKYSPMGWLHVENGIERYTDAMYRHLLDHASGELLDRESHEPHLAHAAWNALAILELAERAEDAKRLARAITTKPPTEITP